MANSNLIKSTLGTNVVVITDSKNREINMLRVKSLNGDDILNLQAKIEANRDTIKKEKFEEETQQAKIMGQIRWGEKKKRKKIVNFYCLKVKEKLKSLKKKKKGYILKLIF